ncbi:MAG: hypothetical protein IJ763_02905 [Lachnospiraceae bacterium]|nr:hypothetical protein [Lachnospiraceae bacterium]
MFNLKDDSEELEVIEVNKKYDDFKVLMTRVEFVLDGYRSQMEGLRFKERRLDKDRRDSIYLVVGTAAAELLIILLCPVIPVLFLFAIPISIAFYGCFPFMLGSMVKRNFQYVVMMEKKQAIKFITQNHVKTFKDEERFINSKILEYDAVLEKNRLKPEVTEEDIIELEKLTRPEEFHADPIEKDFKMWPFWVVTILWVLIDLIILL